MPAPEDDVDDADEDAVADCATPDDVASADAKPRATSHTAIELLCRNEHAKNFPQGEKRARDTAPRARVTGELSHASVAALRRVPAAVVLGAQVAAARDAEGEAAGEDARAGISAVDVDNDVPMTPDEVIPDGFPLSPASSPPRTARDGRREKDGGRSDDPAAPTATSEPPHGSAAEAGMPAACCCCCCCWSCSCRWRCCCCCC